MSATPPLVVHFFSPQMTYESPSSNARTESRLASDPANFSDRQKATNFSPLAICGSQLLLLLLGAAEDDREGAQRVDREGHAETRVGLGELFRHERQREDARAVATVLARHERLEEAGLGNLAGGFVVVFLGLVVARGGGPNGLVGDGAGDRLELQGELAEKDTGAGHEDSGSRARPERGVELPSIAAPQRRRRESRRRSLRGAYGSPRKLPNACSMLKPTCSASIPISARSYMRTSSRQRRSASPRSRIRTSLTTRRPPSSSWRSSSITRPATVRSVRATESGTHPFGIHQVEVRSPSAPQDARDLGQHRAVPVVPEVAEGAEQHHDAVEAPGVEGQGARVRAHQAAREPTCAVELPRRAEELGREIDAEGVHACLQEGQRVPREAAAQIQDTPAQPLGQEEADLLARRGEVAMGIDLTVVGTKSFDVPGFGGHRALSTWRICYGSVARAVLSEGRGSGWRASTC